MNEVISHLEARPHPPVIMIAPRMIPRKQKRAEDDISYVSVRSFERSSSERLILRLLRDREVTVADQMLNELVTLCDGHPFNVYRMVDEIVERGLDAFLANPSDFISWKHRQSSDYLKKVTLDKDEVPILGILKVIPQLDFDSIVSTLKIEPAAASEALLRLTNLHIIESSAEMFIVAPALRVAIELDKRIQIPKELEKTAMKTLAESLSIRLEEGTAPVALVDAAVTSALESGALEGLFAAAFLLPSHHVRLAKRNYDQRQWVESIRLAREALKSSGQLSSSGFVAACRFMCLSAARIGEAATFEEGIAKLKGIARDDWAKSNVAFLEAFNLRMAGNLPLAEKLLREAYDLSPGNMSVAREIASICLARGKLDEAEHFAREALDLAASNRYIIDILVSILIKKYGGESKGVAELDDLFDRLEAACDEGESFFTTRKAEFEYHWGDNKKALEFVEKSLRETPNLFEPLRLAAEIHLKDGNKLKARETIRKMGEIVNARRPSERRRNYRQYLETHAKYLTEVGEYSDAKKVYENTAVFTDEERQTAFRDIEIVQEFKRR